MEEARPATGDDAARLAQLARAAIEELSAERGGAVWQRHSARPEPVESGFEVDLAAEGTLVLVGTIGGSTVGYAVVDEQPLLDGAPLAVIRDLYVEPDARGVGVGAALMDAIVAWAGERHCVGLDALALPGSRATKNFFESFGLVARAIVVHRDLEPGS